MNWLRKQSDHHLQLRNLLLRARTYRSNVVKKKAGTGGSGVVVFGSSLKGSKVRGKVEIMSIKAVKKSTATLSPSIVVKGSKIKGKDETKGSNGALSANKGVRKRTKKTSETNPDT